jgi:hypothetical protein
MFFFMEIAHDSVCKITYWWFVEAGDAGEDGSRWLQMSLLDSREYARFEPYIGFCWQAIGHVDEGHRYRSRFALDPRGPRLPPRANPTASVKYSARS